MTDWIAIARYRDDSSETDGPVITAALIAIAEELRKINDRAHVVVNVPADEWVPEQAVEFARKIS